MEMFPSPYGDFVFQLTHRLREQGKQPRVFPSPYGDFVFQLTLCPVFLQATAKSFRPLTGILFFN